MFYVKQLIIFIVFVKIIFELICLEFITNFKFNLFVYFKSVNLVIKLPRCFDFVTIIVNCMCFIVVVSVRLIIFIIFHINLIVVK
jgi:hypothetical protein